MRKLLVEYMPFNINPELINESIKENNGRLVVKGVLQREGVRNQNGRIYPKNVLMREAKKYVDNFIKDRRALGELDHPESSVVSLSNASHNITEMHWDGSDLVGTVEVLSTPAGNILKELFRSGVKVGISSRGLGSVKEIHEDGGNPTVEVQDDFELIAFDFVSQPSTHGAFLSPVNESVNSNNKMPADKYSNIHRIVGDIINDING